MQQVEYGHDLLLENKLSLKTIYCMYSNQPTENLSENIVKIKMCAASAKKFIVFSAIYKFKIFICAEHDFPCVPRVVSRI